MYLVSAYSRTHAMALFFMISFLFFGGCKEPQAIKDFTSDGCSLFPNRSIILEKDWCDCCFEHDKVYWMGGTEQERLDADIIFRDCILEKTADKNLSEFMYKGVRFGGSPYFFTWYRWGYGWPYDREYVILSEDEKKLIQLKLDEYYRNNPPSPCNK